MPRFRWSRALLATLPALALGLGVCCVNVTTNTIRASSTGPLLPQWFTLVLGAALPWLLVPLVNRLPSWLKPLVAYAIAAAVAAAAGFLFAGWRSLADVARNLPALWASMQLVFSLLVRPARDAATRGRRRRERVQ